MAKKNPTGPEDGHMRVMRGGGWLTDPDFAKTTYNRGYDYPASRRTDVGFRCVFSPE